MIAEDVREDAPRLDLNAMVLAMIHRRADLGGNVLDHRPAGDHVGELHAQADAEQGFAAREPAGDELSLEFVPLRASSGSTVSCGCSP